MLCRCVSDAERHGVGERRVRQEQGAGPAVDVLLRGLLREPKTLLCCAASYLEVPRSETRPTGACMTLRRGRAAAAHPDAVLRLQLSVRQLVDGLYPRRPGIHQPLPRRPEELRRLFHKL